jgi:HK97 family phage major capsid protein
MKSIQGLREQRAAKGKELHDLVNKDGDFTENDQSAYDTGLAEVDRIDAEIKRIEQVNARLADETREERIVEAAERHERNTGESTKLFQRWLRGGDNALNAADWEQVRNAQSTGTDSEGGFTVDSEVARSVVDALKAYGGMRGVATVLQTEGGGAMSFPTSDGTAEIGEIITENQTATDEDVSFGTVGLPVFKFSSKVITVPIELLQDSAIDIEGFVRGRLITRLGRITNRLFTVGTGTAQPRGLITAATVGHTGSGAALRTNIDYDGLVALESSIDEAYRQDAAFMLSDAALSGIRKIKDNNGRPIFVPGYEQGNPGGAPDRLLNRPIVVNNDVAAPAAGAKSIAFGDFSGYYIRDVMSTTLFRFTDSAYTKKGQVGFLGWHRSGGNLIDANAVRVYKNAPAA